VSGSDRTRTAQKQPDVEDAQAFEMAELLILSEMNLSFETQWSCALMLGNLRRLRHVASAAGTSMDDLSAHLQLFRLRQLAGKH
jgi:hypothetical protein